jgi:chemotaxis protein methyltransferase CheR
MTDKVAPIAPVVGAGDVAFASLLAKIARERDFQCQSYKEKCLRRRIAVRLRARGVATYEEYATLLDGDAREYDKLLDALTINVTKLFRNWETYAAIQRLVVPTLWSLPGRTLNIWSAGCASGEEAYSLGILCHRHAMSVGDGAAVSRINVLGTDIDRESLISAGRAAYAEAAFADTPAELRAGYFSAGWPAAVDPRIQAIVRFARHDLIRQPATSGQHLIACRNVIIYFDRDTQEALLRRFHAALVPGGFLVLGKVETLLGDARKLFLPVDARERIFQRI